MPSASKANVCADCAKTSSSLSEIRKRYLCSECFSKYVYSKILKRMEPYRFKNQVGDHRRRLLLPLSGGVSSLALLHVLDTQLKKQMDKHGRSAYDLVLVHVKDEDQGELVDEWRKTVQTMFANHEFLPLVNMKDIIEHNPTFEEDLTSLGLTRNTSESSADLIIRLFSVTRTVSAKSDLQTLLLDRLLVALARESNCDGIIWGHSDSRLAAKTLADVAKGRGGAVSTAIADGPSPWGLNFNYPARELYKTELELYVRTQPEDISGCIMHSPGEPANPVSIRNTSIDDLLTGYITSQGEKYPSIMANVVRTAGKLQVPPVLSSQKCKLCSASVVNSSGAGNLCYGCNRMKQDIKF